MNYLTTSYTLPLRSVPRPNSLRQLFIATMAVIVVAVGLSRPAAAQNSAPSVIHPIESSVRQPGVLELRESAIQIEPLTLSGDFTVEAWVRFAEGETISNTDGLVAGPQHDINFFRGQIRVYDGGAGGNQVIASSVATAGVWAHYAIVRQNTLTSIYINGQLNATAASAWNRDFIVESIGSGLRGANTGTGSNARFEDLMIWDTARSAAQVVSDMSGDIAGSNGPVRRYEFNDMSDYMAIDEQAVPMARTTLSGDFTIASWVNFDANQAINNVDGLVASDRQDINFHRGRIRLHSAGSDIVVANTTAVAGRWTHYALVRSNGFVSIYINGSLDSTASRALNTDFTVDHYGTGIAGLNRNSGLSGRMARLSLRSEALTEFEIAALANPFADQIDLDARLSSAMVADSSGNSAPAALPAGAAIVRTSGNYLDVNSALIAIDPITLTGDFTIESWVRFDSGQSINNADGLVASANQDINFFDTTARLHQRDRGDLVIANTGATTGVWTHYAVVRNNGVTRIYIDGELDSTGTPGWNDNFRIDYIGTGIFGVTTGAGLSGALDDFLIWDSARTPAQLAADLRGNVVANNSLITHFTFDGVGPLIQNIGSAGNLVLPAGAGIVSESNDTNNDNGGGDTELPAPIGENRSLQVTGSTLATGNIALTDDFAISSWVYFNDDAAINSSAVLVQGSNWSLDFANGVFSVNVNALGGTIADTNTPIESGRWAHYAVVRTNGFFDVYINGNFETSSRTDDRLSQVLRPAWNDTAVITGLFTGIAGVVDDARIYNNTREQAQIQEDLTGDLGNSSDLIRYFSFNGSSSAIVDNSNNSANLAVPTEAQFSGSLAPFVVPRVANEFSEVQIATGLELPTDLSFLPDGRMIVVEKNGEVNLFADPTIVNSERGLYIDLSAVTNNVAERGMLAVEVDPDFETNNFVYLYNTFLNADNTVQKAVVRYKHVEQAGGASSVLDPASATVIWREAAVPLARAARVHHGGGLAIAYEPVNGADPSPYKLYIVTSDESNPGSSANLGSDNGKVHRVNLVDGSIPIDNPYYEAAAAARYNPRADVTTSVSAAGVLTTIHSFGVRNGWRASYDQQTRSLIFGEVGGSVQTGDEDIHIAVPRADYGWPTEEGLLANRNDPGNPILSWNHVGGPGRNDIPTDGTSSVTGGVIYRGAKFPAQFQGAYFYGDWSRQWIRYAKFDFSGSRPVLIEDNFFRNSTGHVLSFEQGPDGALYYLTTNQTADVFTFAGQVNRLDFDSGNSAPFGSGILADASALNATRAPHTVQFGANVFDIEGDALSYTWNFGDGAFSSAAAPSHTFTSRGEFEVSLIVTDANGAASTFRSVFIRVGELPQVTVSASQPRTYRAGDTITVDGFAIDSIDGRLNTGRNLTWSSQYFISDIPRPGPFENGEPYATGGITFTTPNTGNVESFLTSVAVTLRAENSQGLTGSETITLTAETSSISMDAPNENVLIAIDGHITEPGDYTFGGVVNFLFDFEAQASYVENGEVVFFSHWSDDPSNTNPVRQIAMPATPTAIVAVYEAGGGLADAAPAGQACYFDNVDFSWTGTSGADFRACSPARGITNFSVGRGHNNTISAISVGSGVHTIIYDGTNGTGQSQCISSNTDVNTLGALVGRASSFEITAGVCPGTAPADPAPADPAPAGQACYFDNADFSSTGTSGADFRACSPARGITNFSAGRGHNNTISGISVGSGVHTIIYDGTNGTGQSQCISSNTNAGALGVLADRASSFEITASECPGNAPADPAPADPAPAGQACYFDNADFSATGTSGADFRACSPARGITNFSATRGHNNAISAISVGSGVHTIIYDGANGSGDMQCITSGTDTNVLGDLANRATSFVIGTGACP